MNRRQSYIFVVMNDTIVVILVNYIYFLMHFFFYKTKPLSTVEDISIFFLLERIPA